MFISFIKLRNWKNFSFIEVPLSERLFLVGPNASGKSNFLDVFRFLRDIASSEGGGLRKAINIRGGIKKIRCLSARRKTDIEIEVHLSIEKDQLPEYRYHLGICQENTGSRRILITHEKVWFREEQVLSRPDEEDIKDDMRLTQTALEQISKNARFREMAKFFQNILYLHLVPQLVRHSREYSGPGVSGDPFGREFLERISRTDKRTKKSRLKKIERALQKVVPNLKEISYIIDEKEGGFPHLEAVYEHWRPRGAHQRESEFSDGTLRLIGLFWSILEGESLLLLEEPELSLNAEIIKRLPALFYKLLIQKKKKRQVMVSTHSWELLQDKGIGGEEALLLTPGTEGTDIKLTSNIAEIRRLLDSGMSVGEAVMPKTAPPNFHNTQLDLFE